MKSSTFKFCWLQLYSHWWKIVWAFILHNVKEYCYKTLTKWWSAPLYIMHRGLYEFVTGESQLVPGFRVLLAVCALAYYGYTLCNAVKLWEKVGGKRHFVQSAFLFAYLCTCVCRRGCVTYSYDHVAHKAVTFAITSTKCKVLTQEHCIGTICNIW